MRVTLDYGRTGLEVELPDDRVVGPLEIQPAPPLPDPLAAVEHAIAHPIESPPLADLARGRRDACILVSDITRPVPNEFILKPVLRTLQQAGIPRDKILLLIATGLHRPNEGPELIEILGPEIAQNYRIENHHGKLKDEHTYLGTTPRGVPVWLDTRYLHADLKIATGLIEPHLMAGFSGGRKLICPGIAHLDTVRVWHGPDFLEHPKADSGILDGNPVHEENTRIARLAGCDFIVNVTIDTGASRGTADSGATAGLSSSANQGAPSSASQGATAGFPTSALPGATGGLPTSASTPSPRRITSVVAGDLEAAFLEGVRFARQVVRATVPEPVDIVVTSCAGYPLDTTFYQSVKGLTGALPIVKQGGTIIMAASLSEGIGSPEFARIFDEHPDLDVFIQRILGKDYFVLDQWQLEELAKVLRKARVTLVSDGLPPATLRRLFVDAAPSVESALSSALAHHGPHATIAVIPKGPYVLPSVA